jgi:ADP-ribose pyrophosphatase
MTYETIQSEILLRGRVFNVRRDQVRLPNGEVVQLNIVEHVGAVTLVPVDEQGRIWFVRQYRHATRGLLLELPAGMVEVGESPEECAHREIREEIGMAAGQLSKIGEYFLAPGYSTEYMHVYLATNLHPAPLPGDIDEFLSVETIPIKEAFHLAESGQLRDAKSLACLLLARPFLLSGSGG